MGCGSLGQGGGCEPLSCRLWYWRHGAWGPEGMNCGLGRFSVEWCGVLHASGETDRQYGAESCRDDSCAPKCPSMAPRGACWSLISGEAEVGFRAPARTLGRDREEPAARGVRSRAARGRRGWQEIACPFPRYRWRYVVLLEWDEGGSRRHGLGFVAHSSLFCEGEDRLQSEPARRCLASFPPRDGRGCPSESAGEFTLAHLQCLAKHSNDMSWAGLHRLRVAGSNSRATGLAAEGPENAEESSEETAKVYRAGQPWTGSQHREAAT